MMKRSLSHFGVARLLRSTGCDPVRRMPLHTSTAWKGIRDRFVPVKDLNKRPSDLEIEQKQLPKNTPTLGERIRRTESSAFFNRDRHSGYFKGLTGTWHDYVDPEATAKDLMVEGYHQIKKELVKFKDERTTFALLDFPKIGEERVAFSFDTEEDSKSWVVTCDSTWGEGYSSAEFVQSPVKGKVIFRGNLSTRIPQDGRTQYAGYANVKSVVKLKSFGRVQPFGWQYFTHLIVRVRGDGRTYKLNLHVDSEFDVHWTDVWSVPLYTRGGPYWQTTVVPFSKFILTAKNMVQDDIIPVDLWRTVAVGITCMDRIDGPFSLELDSIRVKLDPSLLDEVTPYETYRFPTMNYSTP